MRDCKLVSKFDYDLKLTADGKVIVSKNCDEIQPFTDGMPPIKEIVNVRTLTIIEARGSDLIYVNGEWYYV